MDEEKLIKLNKSINELAKGDVSSLEVIYREMGGNMYAVAVAVTKNKSLAEDCVSESLIKIAKNAKLFHGGNASGWIITIVRNTAINIIKAENKNLPIPDEEFYPLSESDPFCEKSDLTISVESAMLSLPENERRAIYFYYFEDLNVRETAKKMKMSKSSVQRLLSSAEKKLKQIL